MNSFAKAMNHFAARAHQPTFMFPPAYIEDMASTTSNQGQSRINGMFLLLRLWSAQMIPSDASSKVFWSRQLKTLGQHGTFTSGHLSETARVVGFDFLGQAAEHIQKLHSFERALVPILFKGHWRLCCFSWQSARQHVQVALLDSQMAHESATPSLLSHTIRIYGTLSRLLQLDYLPPTGRRQKIDLTWIDPECTGPTTPFTYLNLQAPGDQWSCGYWCIALSTMLLSGANRPMAAAAQLSNTQASELPALLKTCMHELSRDRHARGEEAPDLVHTHTSSEINEGADWQNSGDKKRQCYC